MWPIVFTKGDIKGLSGALSSLLSSLIFKDMADLFSFWYVPVNQKVFKSLLIPQIPRLDVNENGGKNPKLYKVMTEVSEWLRLLPFLGVLALLGYLAVRPFLPKKKQQKDSLINLKIQKENPKVVNEINIEDLCLTKAYCRCWRSKTFPVCDGSHNKHNELTGDNVGPLILKKKEV
ncbi:CDGSH iron-sulfur domain-containing protein 2B [Willisornis vidua]|uniref:CDGSH iron-sulfur domain-containing protein 2 n=55 Tax=Aves TaxID=8782 RepID=A0ABQ9CTF9_9PASS|nr:CDGSH iron-sulfur domain-containing protein 2B [Willisornis vidua]